MLRTRVLSLFCCFKCCFFFFPRSGHLISVCNIHVCRLGTSYIYLFISRRVFFFQDLYEFYEKSSVAIRSISSHWFDLVWFCLLLLRLTLATR